MLLVRIVCILPFVVSVKVFSEYIKKYFYSCLKDIKMGSPCENQSIRY